MWANTLWPFSSSTRNMAFGRGSVTVPSSTIASSLGLARVGLLDCRDDRPGRPVHRARATAYWTQGRRVMLARARRRSNSTSARRAAGACGPLTIAGRSGKGEDLGAVLGDGDGVL